MLGPLRTKTCRDRCSMPSRDARTRRTSVVKTYYYQPWLRTTVLSAHTRLKAMDACGMLPEWPGMRKGAWWRARIRACSTSIAPEAPGNTHACVSNITPTIHSYLLLAPL
jgi:hypothetical protein